MKPAYDGGSIINLSSSILASQGVEPRHPPAHLIDPESLGRVVLIVIDGLGADTFDRLAVDLASYRIGTLTSVFPSTTASAIPSIMTALTPAEHGIFGWFLDDPRYGGVIEPLRFESISGSLDLDPEEVIDDLGVAEHSMFAVLDSELIVPEQISKSPFTCAMACDRPITGYRYVEELSRLIPASSARFVHVYISLIDSISHDHGKRSHEVSLAYAHLERILMDAFEALSDATVLITADHGQIEVDRIIRFDAWDAVCAPPSGDARMTICRTNASFDERFTGPIRSYDPDVLISEGWFGPSKMDPRLRSRLGDRILIPDSNVMLDWPLVGASSKRYRGAHSGWTREELEVPLLRFDAKRL